MDSQSVKNTDTAGHKGYDAGKKVSGIKRRGDTQGLPHDDTRDYRRRLPTGLGLWRRLTGAETASGPSAERAGGRGLHHAKALCSLRCKVVASRGGPVFETLELHTFTAEALWVVERSFAWLEKAADSGRTAKESSIPACKWWCLPVGANPRIRSLRQALRSFIRSVHSPAAGPRQRCRAEPKRNSVVSPPGYSGRKWPSVETVPEGETSSTVRSRKKGWLKSVLISTNSMKST